MTANDSPFALRTVLILILVGGCAIAGAAYLALYGEEFGDPGTVQPSSYSRSAIGHRAFVETMRRLGIPILISRFDSPGKAGEGSLLVVAEPNGDAENLDLLDSLTSLPRALLVLPKWRARADLKKPIWAERRTLVSGNDVLEVIANALGDAKLQRHTGDTALKAGLFPGQIKLTDAQFITSDDLKPLISGPDGTLLGEYAKGGNRLWVLSDPDLLSNQGIDKGDNAQIAFAIVAALRPSGGLVVFDETSHGFGERPNLLHRIFQLPYSSVTFSAALAILLLVWAGGARFGGPQPAEPVLAPGKGTLIRNAADLLCLGRSVGMVLSGYLRTMMAEAMRELRGPSGLDEGGQVNWLDRQAARRGLGARLVPLRDDTVRLTEAKKPDARRALRLAMDIHQWKEEMLNGAGRGSSPR